ncbi:MAG: formylglycine-generating enzyme family protein [Candidatus Adiutrix sp.]|jgi:formylglycine-generating enzyme required for sulfatase activity|nr:formylglycine-generating enzyme family protein [Candidatus Adiutrix sp.]
MIEEHFKKIWAGLLSALILSLVMGAAAALAEGTHVNSIGMEFVLIPAGSFVMGAPESESKAWASLPGRPDRDVLPHQVTISQPFYLGKYEVTQGQWAAVMGDNPSRYRFEGENNPVENVSWDDIQVFIQKLNQKDGTDRYRLPTEAEWEYAARAGTTSAYSFGDDDSELGRYAWHQGNARATTHPVGQKEPNAWGLYDMYGNVWELTADWYGANYYADSPASDPRGPSSGTDRVHRGGSFVSAAAQCRSAYRLPCPPGTYNSNFGFRLAISASSM